MSMSPPVNEAQLVYGLQGEGGLCHVELGGLLGQGVLLHEERHHVTCEMEGQ